MIQKKILDIGHWNLFDYWCLEFGYYHISY